MKPRLAQTLALALALLGPAAQADGQNDPVVLARVQPAGGYAKPPSGHSVTVLEGGAVLLVGQAVLQLPLPPEPLPKRLAQWRARGLPDSGPLRPPPVQLWDAQPHEWRAEAAPPDCPTGLRSQHSATALDATRVLIGGGLCEPLQAAGQGPSRSAHADLAVFDAQTRRWSPAGRLTDARMLHSASALGDGTVWFLGGLTDPAVAQVDGWPVLRSVERWRQGQTEPVAPLAQARAGHSASLLADGGLLVVGGFDAEARPLASVERWLPAEQRWQTVAPLASARHGHTATRLSDGRVLVTGGVNAAGEALRSTELFDPATNQWSPGPELPSALQQHSATLLADGAVLVAGGLWPVSFRPLPWAWLWRPDLNGWRVAGKVVRRSAGENPARAAGPVHLHPLPDGGALAFLDHEVLRITRLPDGPRALAAGEVEAPVWERAPVLAALQGGQLVLAVGRSLPPHTAPRPGPGLQARLFERSSGRWRAAPDLPQAELESASALQLPSGRVVLVGATRDDHLACWSWRLGEPAWSACGGVPLLQSALRQIVLEPLPDGRLLALPSTVQAVVFDEAALRWTDWRVRRGPAQLRAGSGVVPEGPVAEITAPDGGQALRIDGPMTRAEALRLGQAGLVGLWDAAAQRWSAVIEGHAVGSNLRPLADGCALSSAPLALFDPRSARVSYPRDPGFGQHPEDAWLLLDDGSVFSVHTQSDAADPGAGWQVGKASCAGVHAVEPLQPYFSPVAPRTPHALAGTTLPPPRSASEAAPAPLDRFNGKGKLLLGAGALAVLLVGAGWLRAGRRGALQAALLLAVLGGLWWLGSGRSLETRTQQACEDDIAACLESGNGLLRPAPGGSKSRIPCEFVGLWNWSDGSDTRRIELRANGQFEMAASAKDSRSHRGHWAVQRFGGEDKVVWRSVPVLGDWDINAIKTRRPGAFELVERNGSITRFERLDNAPTKGCEP